MMKLLILLLFIVSCGMDDAMDDYQRQQEIERLEKELEHEKRKERMREDSKKEEEKESSSQQQDYTEELNDVTPFDNRLKFRDSMDIVIYLFGEPDFIEGNLWYYGSDALCARTYRYCTVEFVNDTVYDHDNFQAKFIDPTSF